MLCKFKHLHPDGAEIPAADAKKYVGSRKVRAEALVGKLLESPWAKMPGLRTRAGGQVNLRSVPSEPDEPVFSLTATVGDASGVDIGREQETFGDCSLTFSNVKQVSGSTDPEDFAPLRDFFVDGTTVDAKQQRFGFAAFNGEFAATLERVRS